jgi:myo-inositol-1(or 4)-monophosphatase
MPLTRDALPPLSELTASVVEIVRRAGDLALSVIGDVTGELKDDLTFVTEADKKVERFLQSELLALTPGIGFWGEEYGQHGDQELTWIVDPIDGTNNFLFGIPLWGISAGLAENGESILGVFHLPIPNETFHAYRGGGAFMNGSPIRPRELKNERHQECLGVTSHSARSYDFSRTVGNLRLLGSIATEVVYAARGSLYACISMGDKLVDLGAAECIAREAGCEMTYLSGDPFRLGDWMKGPSRDEALLIGPSWAVQELRERIPGSPS